MLKILFEFINKIIETRMRKIYDRKNYTIILFAVKDISDIYVSTLCFI